jgi:hypothetical protein
MALPGRGRIAPRDPRMNGTEAAYADLLTLRQAGGEVAGWWFEALKLRLAGNTFYTPDFLVQLADGLLELHEVKGFWRDDARVKIKVAAAQYPLFPFVAVQRVKGRWREERF